MAHIDTLQAYDNLIAAEVPEKQARAQVYLTNSSLDNIATKEDLSHLEKRIDSKLSLIEKVGGSFCITMTALLLKIAFWP